MKNKIVWIMAVSILIFAGFMGTMSRLKDNGIFYLKDIEGQREYLELFPVEGVTGDGSHGFIFQLDEGQLSTKHYPFGTEQINTILFAEREGIRGLKKYNYDYYNQDFLKRPLVSVDSAPSKDATLQHTDVIHEEVLRNENFRNEEFSGGETVIADKVDIYLDMWGRSGNGHARVRTGMTLQEEEYYYTRGDYEETDSYFFQSYFSYNDMQVEASSIKLGDTYYCIAIPNRECQGETSLFRIKEEGLQVHQEEYSEKGLYEQREYGDADILCTFPVDEDNRVLGMFAVGESSLGIFRVEGERVFFEIYDTEGKLIVRELVSQEHGSKISEVEADVVAWDGKDVSIYFRMYQVFEQEGTEIWEGTIFGLYQVDEKGLKRLNYDGQDSGKLLMVCRNNLILDVSMVHDEELNVPYYYGYQVHLSVMNGDTGKVLYKGKIQTDYAEDLYKLFSPHNIAVNAPYLEESMPNYYVGDIIVQRQRQISNILPINGKVENIWFR
ncbi:hypothetical protein [Anaerotignum sp. MB30-C6]|uniref:hypothetical protein n=1 Tax=Anaerotignum sp. MB30-C6 TaxID=3070814 RepID=UPI0027DD96F6|nr:hypothetical protein [Anaerotignum sp. MB30-C6]WMI80759.1 hypothetical protein RBQ60_13150 [Anaerotignum sp. MB30-C6]